MKESLASFIRVTVKINKEEEIKEILDIFQIKNYSKGDYFKHPSHTCKKIGFVVSGCVRFYAMKKNGEKVTGRVLEKNNFVSDLISVRTGEQTPISIEMLEPTSMLVASIEDMSKLLETNLTFNKLIREYIAENVTQLGKMHLLFLTGTAKERYQFILENNPNLLNKFPLRFIANMIGITQTQLSRIRKKGHK